MPSEQKLFLTLPKHHIHTHKLHLRQLWSEL